MARRPQARYSIRADDQTAAGVQSATSRLRRFGGGVASTLRGAAARAAAPLAAIGAGFTAIGTAAITASNSIRRLDTLGNVIGITADEMKRLEVVAEQFGSDGQTMLEVITELNRQGREAASDPRSDAAKRFKQLRIEAGEFIKLRPEEKLRDIALALQAVQDEGQRQLLAGQLVGESIEDQSLIRDAEKLEDAFRSARGAGVGQGLEEASVEAARIAKAWDLLTAQLSTLAQRIVGGVVGRSLRIVLESAVAGLSRLTGGSKPAAEPQAPLRTAYDPALVTTNEQQVALQREMVRLLNRSGYR